MESRNNIAKDEHEKQAEIRRQIAALQALLKDVPATPPKRKQREEVTKVIAPGTPSPKKQKPLESKTLAERPKIPSLPHGKLNPKPGKPKSTGPPELPPLQPSKLLSNLASLHARSKITPAEPIARSIGFSEQPAVIESMSHQERDDRLALVEKLVPDPRDHKPPPDDPHFEQLEPNSGIYLSSRKLAHADLQEHMRGRYYLPPSLLYSVIRPLPSNQGYDIPVPGDWLTIAVIAERGPIKLTYASSSTQQDDEDARSVATAAKSGKGMQNTDREDKKARDGGKKYMSLKLVDFGTRTASGANARIRGDALLTLLLFEADSYSYLEDENRPKGSKEEKPKVYRGGSGGAFEACMKLHEGAVIAILNPKILKPYQRNSTAPHPTENILAITPTSSQSIAIIGRSRDLGTCVAMKRDGKVCGSWCDKRVSDSCEYHVENAVKRNRAGRAEFSIGTSGMNVTAHARKPAFDPSRKWGLLPEDGGTKGSSSGDGGSSGGSTYVMPGHVISASGPEYVGEKIGRGREERAKRRREEKKAKEMLSRLLEREGGGGGDRNAAAGAVRKAREFMNRLKGKNDGERSATAMTTGKDGEKRKVCAYSAEVIQRLGFDPAAKGDHVEDEGLKRKLDVLESLQKNRGEIVLGPRPGKRIRSGVRHVPERHGAPPLASISATSVSDDELEREEEKVSSEKVVRRPGVAEDTSDDDDLEVEPPEMVLPAGP